MPIVSIGMEMRIIGDKFMDHRKEDLLLGIILFFAALGLCFVFPNDKLGFWGLFLCSQMRFISYRIQKRIDEK